MKPKIIECYMHVLNNNFDMKFAWSEILVIDFKWGWSKSVFQFNIESVNNCFDNNGENYSSCK